MRGPGSRCLTAVALMLAMAGCGSDSPAGPGNPGTSGVDGGAGAGGRSGSGGGSEGGMSGGAGGAAGSTGGAAGVPDGGGQVGDAGASGATGGSVAGSGGVAGGSGGVAGGGSSGAAGGGSSGAAGGGSSGAAGNGTGGAAGTSSGGMSGGAAGGGSGGAAGGGSGGAAGAGSGGMSGGGSGGAAGVGSGGMSGGGGAAGGVPNGGACLADGNCMSGHCANGFCCASGDCCAVDANCASFGHAAMCGSQATCQGTRIDGVCNSLFRCITTNVDDDTACAGLIASDCGAYPSVTCTAAAAQPADQAARCATGCTSDADCDAAAHCSGSPGTCVADGGAGSACSQANQCASGLTCVDDVCCTSACTGGCMSCALPGSVGTCAPVPSGQDPASECGAVSCVGQYFGWVGNSCFRKADVPAAQAACDGAGACRTQAEECTVQTTQGPSTIACHATCQDPNVATCAGTTAGACSNVNTGNQSCGVGVCRVTVPMCVNGAPNSCTPNTAASSTETCNDLDDNCDGTIDNGSFADGRELNNTCAGAHLLPTVGSDQTGTVTAATLFPDGDVDVYRINAVENDGSCACCDTFCLDEDYELTVTLTVPAGAGSYQLCAARDTCAFPGSGCITVNANSSGNLTFRLDGACTSGATDSYSIYVRVAAGATSPGMSCKPYGLSYFFDAGRCF